jgi:5-(carboxyamino)imidazole ribonucleotide mutase
MVKMIEIIAGSKSDEKIAEKVISVLQEHKITFSVSYISAHRDHDKLVEKVKSSDSKIFICIAGLSAALPGVVASLTEKPVIGVPVSAALNGLDALLSIVQMPKGVPVATVGIDNGQNAAYLALRILGVKKVD